MYKILLIVNPISLRKGNFMAHRRISDLLLYESSFAPPSIVADIVCVELRS